MNARRTWLAGFGGAFLLGLALLRWVAPGYLTGRGFPLDDAWIHAVYARSLATTGRLAYNPGELSAGESAPLWALVLAIPHRLLGDARAIVVGTKLLGLALHAATATLSGLLVARTCAARAPRLATLAGFGAWLLVLVQPDLLAAAVSGMEIPLATALLLAGLLFARDERWRPAAVLAGLAYLARPETAVAWVGVVAARAIRGRRPAEAAPLVGPAVAALVYAAYCLAVTGRPLPPTFYVKAGFGLGPEAALVAGLRTTLGLFAGVGRAVVLVPFAGLAGWSLRRGGDGGPLAVGALLFVVVVSVLTPSFDVGAFYHQRYFLPALPLVVVGLAATLVEALAPLADRAPLALASIALALLADMGAALPARLAHLANDAHNVDDVQVLEGIALSTAEPGATVWAVDAGGIRYFGRAYVVDMIGLNTPAVLDPKSDYTLRHPPTHVVVVPSWSQLDSASFRRFWAQRFSPSTPYTVTSFPMATHWLGRCPPGLDWNGGYRIRGRTYRFRCPTP